MFDQGFHCSSPIRGIGHRAICRWHTHLLPECKLCNIEDHIDLTEEAQQAKN